ncbi:eIF2 kinase Gcn2p negative regulator [Myotisia sp. PD_48]|nr:eIF2 kinase Gcn2p negative regulator [Myotisia sp. PD_48]
MSDHPEETTLNEELAEEILAINAIYGPSTITLTANSLPRSKTDPAIQDTIILQIPNHEQLSFLVGFRNTYPSTPPLVIGPASTGSSRGEGKKWTDILTASVEKVWTSGVCLYDLIVEAEERFDATKEDKQILSNSGAIKSSSTSYDHIAADHSKSDDDDNALQSGDKGILSNLPLCSPPEWIISDPITEKKSVFIARVATVQTKEQAGMYLDHLLAAERKVASATHNITAWRIRQRQEQSGQDGSLKVSETVVQDSDDDGETAAGGRLLLLLQLMDVWNVVVVVSRWYGGVKLGPDRFRLINAAARDALVKGEFGGKQETNQADKGGKKKGKK